MRFALTPWDRARLHGSGVRGFRKGSGEQRADLMVGKPPKIGVSTYGYPKSVAKRYLAGHYGAMTVTDVAAREKITYAAMRTALYKLGGIKGDRQKRRAA